MKEIVKSSTLLELHVPDFNLVKEFYRKLGFEVVWERSPEKFKGYLVLKMNENILCFWAGNDSVYEHPYFMRYGNNTKRGYGVEVVIMVENVEQCYEEVKDRVKVVEELMMRPWGLKDFRVEDPFGYYLRITERHNILDPSNAVK